jgi:hypothetical protein
MAVAPQVSAIAACKDSLADIGDLRATRDERLPLVDGPHQFGGSRSRRWSQRTLPAYDGIA